MINLEDNADLDYSLITQDAFDFEDEVSILKKIWNVLFAIIALLDIAASMANDVPPTFVQSPESSKKSSDTVYDARDSTNSFLMIPWLRKHSLQLNALFSFLWFIDAFVRAHHYRKCRQKIFELERSLHNSEIVPDKSKSDWTRFQFICYIICQILLLPVGFFVYCFTIYREIRNPDHRFRDSIEITSCTHNFDGQDSCDIYTTQTSLSLLFATLKRVLDILSIHMVPIYNEYKQLSKNFALSKAKGLITRLIRGSIRNPFQSVKKAQQIIRSIRWIRYLTPLVLQLPKLKGAVIDLLKKKKQKRNAAIAKRFRGKFKQRLSEQELLEYSAICIQKTYRCHRLRKLLRAWNLFYSKLRNDSAVRIQTMLRTSLARARLRISINKMRLKKIYERERRDRKWVSDAEMTISERDRFYGLEKQLRYYFNGRLLLRPNSAFSVTWRSLFVLAVCIEILVSIIEAVISNNPKKSRIPGIAASLENFLIPTPVAQLSSCRVEGTRLDFRRPLQSVIRLLEILHLRNPPKPKPIPWYCHKWYGTIQFVYISITKFCIEEIVTLIGIIYYLDVFIDFFTGVYDSETGALKPRPFFQRYFFPGLTFQLFVNPRMANTSRLVTKILNTMIYYGPIRVLRWTVALFLPISKLSSLILIFWRKLVEKQNQKLLQLDHGKIKFYLPRPIHECLATKGKILRDSPIHEAIISAFR